MCVPQVLETRGKAGRQITLNYFSGTVCVSAGEARGKGVFSVYTQPNHIDQSPNIVVFTKTTCPVPLFYSLYMSPNF